MKKAVLSLLLLLVGFTAAEARKYPFDMNHSYEVQMVRVANQGYKYIRVSGIAKSVDKAMDRAMQDAVAACVFVGVPGAPGVGAVPALCGGTDAYEKHKAYFDNFFKNGEFMHYVKNVNSNYPSGENNVKVDGGRKVTIYVLVSYDALRKKLEEDKIIKSLNSYF